MVIRSRLRAFLFPLMLYSAAGTTSAYFIWTAKNGDRGLRTKLEYKKEIASLRIELDGLKADRERWAHRVVMMRSEAVDRDLSEEQARIKLGYVDPRDVMVFESSTRP